MGERSGSIGVTNWRLYQVRGDNPEKREIYRERKIGHGGAWRSRGARGVKRAI